MVRMHLAAAGEKPAHDLLTWPEKVRGFGYVRAGNAEKALRLRERRISTLANAEQKKIPA